MVVRGLRAYEELQALAKVLIRVTRPNDVSQAVLATCMIDDVQQALRSSTCHLARFKCFAASSSSTCLRHQGMGNLIL